MKLLTLLVAVALSARVESQSARAPPARTCAVRPTQSALLRKRQINGCAEDACMSALQASAQVACARVADVDCASYFVTTLTPDISTFYETLSFYATLTTTDSVTETTTRVDEFTATTRTNQTIATTSATTTTLPGTYTVTHIITVTSTEDETATNTLTTTGTTTQGVFLPPVPQDPFRKRKAKRGLAKRIPGYASVCSGEPGYASACACIGVTSSITYVATPSTTVSISSTLSGTVTESSFWTESSVKPTTTTETITSTVVVVAATSTSYAQGPFYIYVQSEAELYPGDTLKPVLDMYVNQDFSQNLDAYSLVSYGNTGAQYYIDGEGYLRPVTAPRADIYFTYLD
ncbi:hypothetical protein GE09DRAFT_148991 [Coniochaeta sp. 2T2.1]|nr:hypothetical protein GE09DRAFT_148991 [Coniochaeta sp. 2T2.1]